MKKDDLARTVSSGVFGGSSFLFEGLLSHVVSY